MSASRQRYKWRMLSKKTLTKVLQAMMTTGNIHGKAAESAIPAPDLIEPGAPPRYTIDLSLPPRERYVDLAKAYKDKIVTLPILFDGILSQLHNDYPFLTPWFMKSITRLLLRRIHDSEQMEELTGIQYATGIEMYLLVAFNVLLDMFVGCTSGGVRVMERAKAGKEMMHFRTLDWDMDPLRKVVVQLDFVSRMGGPVVARSVTYLGFVGVLTGVRHGLSISFNFRSNMKSWQILSRWEKLQYMGEKVLVLLGRRASIPCTLRKYIIPSTRRIDKKSYRLAYSPLPTLKDITKTFPNLKTAQCFIIACDGVETTVIEKDWKTATLRSDTSFIACTNHDQAEEDSGTPLSHSEHNQSTIPESATLVGMQEILEESVGRKQCVEQKWIRVRNRYLKDNPGSEDNDVAVTLRQVQGWITSEPIYAGCTHYAVIMDPSTGDVAWSRRFPEPIYEDDDDEEDNE